MNRLQKRNQNINKELRSSKIVLAFAFLGILVSILTGIYTQGLGEALLAFMATLLIGYIIAVFSFGN